MTATADRYDAYTDGELADLWNFADYAQAERDTIALALVTRGYTPENEYGNAIEVVVPDSRRGYVGSDEPHTSAVRYRVALTRLPDPDGYYRAEIRTVDDDEYVTSLLGTDREQLRARVADRIERMRSPKQPDEVYEV